MRSIKRVKRRSIASCASGSSSQSSHSSRAYGNERMLTAGQTLTVSVEKPAVGGRMIAHVDRQVVLVDGAIPGERVSVRIVRVGKGVAYADTLAVEERSPDRRDGSADRACGGCLYTHI